MSMSFGGRLKNLTRNAWINSRLEDKSSVSISNRSVQKEKDLKQKMFQKQANIKITFQHFLYLIFRKSFIPS